MLSASIYYKQRINKAKNLNRLSLQSINSTESQHHTNLVEQTNQAHTILCCCSCKLHSYLKEKNANRADSKTDVARHEFLRVKHVPPQYEGEWCVLIYRE